MNPNSFIDVHTYDGKLVNMFYPKIYYTTEQKESICEQLFEKLNDSHAKTMLDIIKRDMRKRGGGNNYQKENRIDASDILASILDYDYDLLLLEEQLADASKLGRCPAGRVNRLFQVWKATVN